MVACPHHDPLVARFYGLLEAEFATDATQPKEVRIDIVHLAQEIVVRVEANASMVQSLAQPTCARDPAQTN